VKRARDPERGAFWIEFGASVFTVAGMYLGSTTLEGAACYAVSLAFWFWLMPLKRLWGLLPLNVASAIVTAINLLHAAR
jgi:hypothetical protein